MDFFLKDIFIRDNASPVNSVTLTNISDGVDGSSVFSLSKEQQELQIENGQTYVNRMDANFDVRVLKPSSSDITQLQSWADNQTDLYVLATTVTGAIVIGNMRNAEGACKISINEQLTDSDVFAFKMTNKGCVGYDTNNGLYEGGVFAGKNIYSLYNWNDDSGDGLASGWEFTGLGTPSFSGDQQTLPLTSGDLSSGDWEFIYETQFPPNKRVTFSIDVDAFVAGNTVTFQFFERDASGSLTSLGTASSGSTGRKSISGTTSSSCVSIYMQANYISGGSTGDYIYSNPALRIDGLTTYTKF